LFEEKDGTYLIITRGKERAASLRVKTILFTISNVGQWFLPDFVSRLVPALARDPPPKQER